MNDVPITEIKIEDLKSYIETLGFKVYITDILYSISKLYPNHVCKWLMTIDNHPARVVAYNDYLIRFQYSIPVIVGGRFTPGSLRKNFPYHMLKAKSMPDLGLTRIEACIPHTEPLIYLIDSLKAAEELYNFYMLNESKTNI